MNNIRSSRYNDGNRALEIWRNAVDATHDFLSSEDRQSIDDMLSEFLPTIPLLYAVDDADYPLGFMIIRNGKMEALFIDAAYRGKGIGTALVRHGLSLHPKMTTDVNEQNTQAVEFYKRLGFKQVGRSEVDNQGRPYPLLHLKFG